MRKDSGGEVRTLDQDIVDTWKLHGWTVKKVVVPRRVNKEDPTTWTVVAAPTKKEASAGPTAAGSPPAGDVPA